MDGNDKNDNLFDFQLTSEYTFDDVNPLDEQVNFEDEWTKRLDIINPEHFNGDPGLKISLSSVEKTLEYFFDKEIINLILKYSNQNIERKNLSRSKKIKTLNKSTLFSYLAIYSYFAIVPIVNVKEAWSKNETSQNEIKKIMSYQHFNDINQIIDVTSPNDYINDKIKNEIKIFIYVSNITLKAYYPLQKLSLDESIVPFKGNLKNPAYFPMKSHSRGMKIYTIAESSSGLCLSQVVCSHKSTILEICTILTKKFKDRNHLLFTDNFYTSVALCKKLMEFKIYLCGTIRKFRGEPKFFVSESKKLKRGECLIIQKDKINLTAFYDKKVVKMLSNFHNHEMQAPETPNSTNKNKTPKPSKPICILDYNLNMGGVDLMDQHLTNYDFLRKTRRWKTKFCLYVFKILLHNAFICFKKSSNKKIIHSEFMISAFRYFKKNGIKNNLDKTIHHLPVFVETRSRCSYCPERKSTTYKCESCNVFLCVKNCFYEIHKNVDTDSEEDTIGSE